MKSDEVESLMEQPCLRRDGGQAAVMFVMAVSTVFVALVVALTSIGGHVIDRSRAQTAADAAALASLTGGSAAARELVEHHGAQLVSWSRGTRPDEVIVVVRVGDATASAAATNAP